MILTRPLKGEYDGVVGVVGADPVKVIDRLATKKHYPRTNL